MSWFLVKGKKSIARKREFLRGARNQKVCTCMKAYFYLKKFEINYVNYIFEIEIRSNDLTNRVDFRS